jgi:cytochrome c peroxidase
VILCGALALGCHATDKVFCGSAGCDWTDLEWARVQSLSPLPAPPADTSNAYFDSPAAAALGQAFYFDTRFSGVSTLVDAIGRPVAAARTAKGSPANVSCATCHDPGRAGTDESSAPNTVSTGAGIYDVNSQQTLVAAFFPLLYWNGRSDSLWSQAIAVNESGVSMNGTRLQVFWTIVNDYYDRYEAVFDDPSSGLPTYPLPPAASITTAEFPLQGKPGSMKGCQPGSTTEPFGDAFDCLSADDQATVDRVFVNFGKAIAAYEYAIASHGDSPFDRFVHDGPGSGWISPQAENGARLFVGKASCIDCHNTPLFSDGRFHNIGVPQAGDHVPTVEDCPSTSSACNCAPGMEAASCLPSGVWAGTLKLAESGFKRSSLWSEDQTQPEACAPRRSPSRRRRRRPTPLRARSARPTPA